MPFTDDNCWYPGLASGLPQARNQLWKLYCVGCHRAQPAFISAPFLGVKNQRQVWLSVKRLEQAVLVSCGKKGQNKEITEQKNYCNIEAVSSINAPEMRCAHALCKVKFRIKPHCSHAAEPCAKENGRWQSEIPSNISCYFLKEENWQLQRWKPALAVASSDSNDDVSYSNKMSQYSGHDTPTLPTSVCFTSCHRGRCDFE